MALHGSMLLGPASGYSGYEISNSAVFDGSSDYLTRTFGTPTNATDWTLSLWIKRSELSTNQYLVEAHPTSNADVFEFASDDEIFIRDAGFTSLNTSRKYRDPGSWVHLVVRSDADSATTSEEVRIYTNGTEENSFVTDNRGSYPGSAWTYFNQAYQHTIGRRSYNGTLYFDGYLAEVIFVDGQSLGPDSFGEFYNGGNQWRPIDPSGLTFGNNGFYLDFSNSGDLGEDQAGSNNWTVNGSPVQSSDSPTVNYCVWNAVKPTIHTLTDGNRTIDAGAAYYPHSGTIGIEPGTNKYFEIEWNGYTGASSYGHFGVCTEDIVSETSTTEHLPGTYGCNNRGTKNDDGTLTTSHFSWSSFPDGTVIGFHVDRINNLLKVYLNGVYESGKDITLPSDGTLFPWAQPYSPVDLTIDCGQASFQYTPPSDTTELSAANLPDPTITDPGEHFNAVGYTANNSTQSITGVGFQPDLTWHKNRTDANRHALFDVLRGVTNRLASDNTDAEVADADTLTSFDSDGFSIGADTDQFGVNDNGSQEFVTWCWKAGGAGSSNSDGSEASVVSVNDDAGFSIVTWDLVSGAHTVGHGQSDEIELIVSKDLDLAASWNVYHKDVGATKRLLLNDPLAGQTATWPWNNTAPSPTVITIGQHIGITGGSAGDRMLAYCFRSIPGYSKVFSYTGNGSANGPFVYLGFEIQFLLIKRSDSSNNWMLFDLTRSPFNQVDDYLMADSNAAETVNSSSQQLDVLCNGIKIRSGTTNAINANGGTYIGLAFAENPFGGSNLPLGLAR